MITLKKIVENCTFEGITFHYYVFDIDNPPISLLFFDALSNPDEKNHYENSSKAEKKEHISNSPAIIIPRMNIDYYVNLLRDNDTNTYNFSMKKIADLGCCAEHNTIGFVLLHVLHEVGHYVHFDEIGRKPFEWATIDDVLRRRVHDEQNKIYSQYLANLLTQSEFDKMRHSLDMRYRDIPIEKRADAYAFSHFPQVLKKVVANMTI